MENLNTSSQNANGTVEQNIETLANKNQFLFSAKNGIGILALRGIKNHFTTKVEVVENTKISIVRESGRYRSKMTKVDMWEIEKEEILSIHKTRHTQASLLFVAVIGILSGVALHPVAFCLALLAFCGLCKKSVCIQLKTGKDIFFYYDNEDTLSAFIKCLDVNTGNMRKGIRMHSPIVTIVLLCIAFVGGILLNSETANLQETSSEPPAVTFSSQTPEEFKSSCKFYTYDEIARQPQKYTGEPICITGQIIQTIESADSDTYIEMRVDVEEGIDTVFYVLYDQMSSEMRFLEYDYVSVYGTVYGLITYESVGGASITIPAIQAKYIEFFDGDRPYEGM